MPNKAQTHEQNRGKVCLICLKKGNSMSNIAGVTYSRVKAFYLSNYDPSDDRLPNGICGRDR